MKRPLTTIAAAVLIAVAAAGCGWISQSVPIQSVTPSEDGLTLGLEVASCGAEISVKVTEDYRSVGLFVSARKGTDAGCLDTITVELDAPLGGRTLIDGFDFTELETGS